MLPKLSFKGEALTLVGRDIVVKSQAPDFRVVSQDLAIVALSDFKDKIKIISSFPSLDTPVCDMQVKEFNKKASNLSGQAVILGISKDLPFAQRRFCQENKIEKEVVLSDYRYSSFSVNYGLLIKELNLVARAVHIIDSSGILRYRQMAPELTKPLDLEDALKNLEGVLKEPRLDIIQFAPSKCVPCETGTPALPKERVDRLLAHLEGWQLSEDKKIVKEFKFKDFAEAKYFLDLVSVIAEDEGHHPTLTLIYNRLKVTLTTHASGGLTDNDFIMARIIDEL